MKHYIYDCECHPNYFLLARMALDTHYVDCQELMGCASADSDTRRNILDWMDDGWYIGFNNRHYDDWLIAAYILGAKPEDLYRLSQEIINDDRSNRPLQSHPKLRGMYDRINGHHIDLMAIGPVFAGLKSYGARLHAHTIQSLPYDPEVSLTREQMGDVRKYCVNDLRLTELLHETLAEEIQLRMSMGIQYGVNLLARSDAQMAEAIYRKSFAGTIKQCTKPSTVSYQAPPTIQFDSKKLKSLVEKLDRLEYPINESTGRVELPSKTFIGDPIQIGGQIYGMATRPQPYKLGIGGLHSMTRGVYAESEHGYQIVDIDVASYYPSLITNLKIVPRGLPQEFAVLYRSLIDDRLAAKSDGDKTTADSLKILINGTFGKLSSPYSCLYDPQALLRVTLSGQLYMLMLIERMTGDGHEVIAANTDGVIVRVETDRKRYLVEICRGWERDTGLRLEYTPYQKLLMANVNSYVAVKNDAGVKAIGEYAPAGLKHLPRADICKTAAIEYLLNDTPPEVTVTVCTDIRQFLFAKTVNGGAVWGDLDLGSLPRWYWSLKPNDAITYKSNRNQVPLADQCTPMQTLDNDALGNVDIDRYVEHAHKLLMAGGIDLKNADLMEFAV